MKITDDVIRDLLPLYLAGEASADTRALVDAYLAEHPDMAAQASRDREWSLPRVLRTGTAEAEREALRRTKTLLSRRSWALGLAIFFTAAPFSFSFGDRRGFQWLVWADHAALASVSLAFGVATWILFAIMDRRLKPKGF